MFLLKSLVRANETLSFQWMNERSRRVNVQWTFKWENRDSGLKLKQAKKVSLLRKNTDTYVCPADSTMKTNGNWYHKKLKDGKNSYYVKHYKPKLCKECKLRESCTSNKNGRVIERTEYQEYINRNNDRVKNNPDYYKQRQQIIEHQFGTLKRHWGFEYVLSRGKENVLSEVYTLFTAYI